MELIAGDEEMEDNFYSTLIKDRSAEGQFEINCMASLFELSVKSLLKHLKKIDCPARDPVLGTFRNQQLLPKHDLPSRVMQKILALCLVVHDEEDKRPPSLWVILQLVTRFVEHLDLGHLICSAPNQLDAKKGPQLDLLSELRSKGVNNLKTLLVPYEWKISNQIVRAEHLVPNAKLVHLQMVQMICSDEDLAILATQCPNLQAVEVGFSGEVSHWGVEQLSKLQKLHSFHFYTASSDSMSPRREDELLAKILQLIPMLRRAGRCYGSKDCLSDMSRALHNCFLATSKPLRLTHIYVDTSYFSRKLSCNQLSWSQLVPELTSLQVSLSEEDGVQEFLGFAELQNLYVVYLQQEQFDALIEHYGNRVKKLRITRKLNLDRAARLCPNLESLECGVDCTLYSEGLRKNPWPLLSEFRSYRFLMTPIDYIPNSIKLEWICMVKKLTLCGTFVFLRPLFKAFDEFHGMFPNLVEATIMGSELEFPKRQVQKFVAKCPKLAKLTLGQEMCDAGCLDRGMFKVPGLQIIRGMNVGRLISWTEKNRGHHGYFAS